MLLLQPGETELHSAIGWGYFLAEKAFDADEKYCIQVRVGCFAVCQILLVACC